MQPMNINNIGGNESNYRLRGEPVKLAARVLVGCRPDGDGWEEVWDETSIVERYRTMVKSRGSRKQRAAHAMIPRASVTIVKRLDVAMPEVVFARLEGKSDTEVRIAELEAKIRALLHSR